MWIALMCNGGDGVHPVDVLGKVVVKKILQKDNRCWRKARREEGGCAGGSGRLG